MNAEAAARWTPTLRRRAGQTAPDSRLIPEEVAIALVHEASTTAVMMATPADLEDFALGFTLTEGLATADQVREIEIVEVDGGIEARVWLASKTSASLRERRRAMAGPTGCGLCGLESLAAAHRVLPAVPKRMHISADQVAGAVTHLSGAQPLGRATHAVHAAGWWSPADGLVLVREDVGRHNALDKLIGGLVRAGAPREGMVVLTSRISIELVQKAAMHGVEIVAAVSAPTTAAVAAAEAAGMTLIGVARDDGFEVFTHAERLIEAE